MAGAVGLKTGCGPSGHVQGARGTCAAESVHGRGGRDLCDFMEEVPSQGWLCL